MTKTRTTTHPTYFDYDFACDSIEPEKTKPKPHPNTRFFPPFSVFLFLFSQFQLNQIISTTPTTTTHSHITSDSTDRMRNNHNTHTHRNVITATHVRWEVYVRVCSYMCERGIYTHTHTFSHTTCCKQTARLQHERAEYTTHIHTHRVDVWETAAEQSPGWNCSQMSACY